MRASRLNRSRSVVQYTPPKQWKPILPSQNKKKQLPCTSHTERCSLLQSRSANINNSQNQMGFHVFSQFNIKVTRNNQFICMADSNNLRVSNSLSSLLLLQKTQFINQKLRKFTDLKQNRVFQNYSPRKWIAGNQPSKTPSGIRKFIEQIEQTTKKIKPKQTKLIKFNKLSLLNMLQSHVVNRKSQRQKICDIVKKQRATFRKYNLNPNQRQKIHNDKKLQQMQDNRINMKKFEEEWIKRQNKRTNQMYQSQNLSEQEF